MNKIQLHLLTLCLIGGFAYGQKQDIEEAISIYQKRQEQMTPSEVISFLKDGNKRFAEGRSTHGAYPVDSTERRKVSAVSQRPLATVLSCIDSRTSPELVFDTAVGDLFTARVGANTLNDEILGSLEITAESGAKAIVVLGHTDCGGIKAACNNLELEHFTLIVEKIKPAIAHAHKILDQDSRLNEEIGERITTNRKYTGFLGHANASQTVRQILEKSSLIKSKVEQAELILIPAIYDVDSGLVKFSEE